MEQYIITDGERFIYRNHKGRYVPTPGEAMADIYSKKMADDIMRNHLPKALRTIFKAKKCESMKTDKGVKTPDIEEIHSSIEKVSTNENVKRWLDKLSTLNGLAEDANKRKQELLSALSNVDKELVDLSHYIEFSNLNASQGYKVYKMERERRCKRRSIKNEITILNVILDKRIGESATEEVKKQLAALDNRTYKPRVLSELFNT